MRLDKFLSVTGFASRKESAKSIRLGHVKVNGIPAKKPDLHINPETDEVLYYDKIVIYRQFTYIMLNKPQGYVSATNDPREKTVLDLLPEELRRIGLFPCGRLDKNTFGLIILTNNGPLSHRLLSPKNRIEKEYYFESKFPLSLTDIEKLEGGVDIGGYATAPCRVILESEKKGRIILCEGKYHQIKLMLKAINNQITYLERIRFGGILLDRHLTRGCWRYLNDSETNSIENETIKP